MRLFQAVLLIHFLKIVASVNFQTIHQTAQIDMSRIGNFVRIGPLAKIGPNCEIDDFSVIAAKVSITNGSTIGKFCSINEQVSVFNNVRVYNHVSIGQNAYLHDNCEIGSFTNIGSYADILPNVQVGDYSSLANNVFVGTGSILDRNSNVHYGTQIGSNVYIGEFAIIGENVVIDNNAVIYKFVNMQDRAHVSRDEVIIKTPSSASLYRDSMALNRIQQAQVDAIINGSNTSVNNLLLDLMKQQFDQLNSTCPTYCFDFLYLVKSLYLLKHHGRQSYEHNVQHQSNSFRAEDPINVHLSGKTFVNSPLNIFISNRDFSTSGFHLQKRNGINGVYQPHQMLDNEFHFGSNDNRNILNDETKDHMIRLLAIESDSQRNAGVHGDTFCKMVNDIKAKRRTVKCDT